MGAVTFTLNYSQSATSWALDHLWSLSVEKQFYILWPSTLAILLRRASKLTAVKVAASLIVVGPLSRIITHCWAGPFYATHSSHLLHTRVATLMFGGLCSLLDGTEHLERVYRVVAKVIWIFPVVILIVSPLLRFNIGDKYLLVLGYTLEGFSVAVTMLWLVRNGSSPIGRLLNSRIVVYVGILSYSLYLWQQLFFNPGKLSLTAKTPINLLCVAAAAILSYRLVERPFLRLKTRFVRASHRPGLVEEHQRHQQIRSPDADGDVVSVSLAIGYSLV
jgi:peptidoglycan/LPS O-acetylase OafA/YrhL